MKKDSIEKQVADLDSKISKLCDQVRELRDQRENLLFQGKNLEGKFVKLKDYGYMFVTWQTLDGVKTKDSILLQGLGFSYCLNEGYTDSAWMDFDALKEYRIPTRLFFEDDEVIEITKDQFLQAFKDGFTNSLQFGLDWIEKRVRNFKKDK